MMFVTIYVLSLEKGKYYIGKGDVEKRFQQHLNGNGSVWTKKYRPKSIIETIENASPFDEDRITKEYMAKYGIDNVRGGSYVTLKLNKNQLTLLKKEIRMAENLCIRCGRNNHFIGNCYARTELVNDNVSADVSTADENIWKCIYCHGVFTEKIDHIIHEIVCRIKSQMAKLGI